MSFSFDAIHADSVLKGFGGSFSAKKRKSADSGRSLPCAHRQGVDCGGFRCPISHFWSLKDLFFLKLK